MAQVTVGKSQITTSGEGETTIRDAGLADLAAKHPEEIAKTLSSEVSPISASALAVDATGRVSIKDAEFTKSISRKMETVVADSGVICPTNAVFC